ncbi:MAG: DUF308 domain-containing protein [Mycobacteriales bacterium]
MTEHATEHLKEDNQSPIRDVAAQVGHLWWVPLTAGVLSIGLGLAVLASDWTVKALVVATGIALVVRGLALAFNPSYASDAAGEQVVAGVIGVVAGVVLIAWPGPTLLVLAVFLGIWLALSGGFHVVTCIARRRHMAQWGLGVAIGTVELLLGLWVMRRPEVTLSLVITVLGLWAVITGVVYCVQAFEIRAALKDAAAAARRRPSTVDVRDRSGVPTSSPSEAGHR